MPHLNEKISNLKIGNFGIKWANKKSLPTLWKNIASLSLVIVNAACLFYHASDDSDVTNVFWEKKFFRGTRQVYSMFLVSNVTSGNKQNRAEKDTYT